MKLDVNGLQVEVPDRHAKTPLLWVLRDVLGVHGVKFGCGAGFCAACTVLLDGRNTKSCQTATERAVGKEVVTVEGASGPVVDAVRDAWHRGNVVQCGYCQPGQSLAAVALLESDPAPDDAAIDAWMSGNLCRCGTYPRIRAAIHDAAGILAAGSDPGPLTLPLELRPARLTHEELADPVHPYVRVREDGTVVVFSTQIEMGQGVHTGFATLVAEELDADFDSVLVVNAANGTGRSGDVYGNPDIGGAFQLTGASNSMKGSLVRYRRAGAQARARLVAAAAEAWQVPVAEVEVDRGLLSHPSGRRATFGELAARAEQLPAPDDVRLKDPSEFKLIGRESRLRVDAPAKFARESAIDELATAAGRDPVDLRRELLAENPRMLRALDVAVERPGWGSPLPEGKARGIACSSFLSYSAQVTEVSLDARGRVHIDRIVDALDCGIQINPDLIRAQVEGGLLFGLSAAAWGEVVLGDGGEILTQNFDRYPVMRMRSTPAIEVHLIESTDPPTGVGEVSTPSAAPALTNAIAALTGTRVRQLPINNTIKIA